MKEKQQSHWAVLEAAEQGAPGNTIDLWAGVKRSAALPAGKAWGVALSRWQKLAAFGVSLVLLLAATFFLVPAARAFAEDIFQRMGIAFVSPGEQAENTTVVQAEAGKRVLPPSLSEEEIRQRIAFDLTLPAWLPEGLDYVYRDVREYVPAEGDGSGQQVSIEYGRSADFDPASGVLYLIANDGQISAPPLLAASREQSVTVNGLPGIYVHGGWQNDGSGDPSTHLGDLQWDDNADDAYLTWVQDGVTYLLAAHNLGLGLDDMLQIAGSMGGK